MEADKHREDILVWGRMMIDINNTTIMVGEIKSVNRRKIKAGSITDIDQTLEAVMKIINKSPIPIKPENNSEHPWPHIITEDEKRKVGMILPHPRRY